MAPANRAKAAPATKAPRFTSTAHASTRTTSAGRGTRTRTVGLQSRTSSNTLPRMPDPGRRSPAGRVMALMPDAAEPHSRPGDVYRSVDGFPDWLARSPANPAARASHCTPIVRSSTIRGRGRRRRGPPTSPRRPPERRGSSRIDPATFDVAQASSQPTRQSGRLRCPTFSAGVARPTMVTTARHRVSIIQVVCAPSQADPWLGSQSARPAHAATP